MKYKFYVEQLIEAAEDKRGLFSEEVKNAQFTYTQEEPVICKRFGCSKVLIPRERLFSDYCINHQDPDEKTIVAVNKYL